MTVKVDIPNYDNLINNVIEETETRVLVEVQNTARVNAPVDSGFYRNNILIDGKEVVANAVYSAVIEYGLDGTRRAPTANMRLSAMEVQKQVPSIFKRVLSNV